MRDLIERLEKAEAGSRELDALVFVSLHEGYTYRPESPHWGAHVSKGGFRSSAIDLPPVTTSLDAALALAERVLPGWTWQIDIQPGERCWVQVAPKPWPEGLAAPDRDGVSKSGAAPALALVAAILRAKDAQ